MKTTMTPAGKSAAAGDAEQAATDRDISQLPLAKAFQPAAPVKDLRNPALLDRLIDYMERENLVNNSRGQAIMGKRLNYSSTYVFRYLKNKFQGNLKEFEDRLTSLFAGEFTRVTTNTALVREGFIVQPMKDFLRHCKAHGHIGVGYGPAGKGKTCAARLYIADDKTAIYVHVNEGEASRAYLVQNIARAAGIRLFKKPPPNEVLAGRLAGSDRLIILDNAHKLHETARSWIADFWEVTRVPFALIGNPEIIAQFGKNDQHGSRVGLRRDVTRELDKTAEISAAHMLRLHFPEAEGNPKILKEATAVLHSFGSCRTLLMRAKLAHEIIKGGKHTDPADAFERTKTQLITAA